MSNLQKIVASFAAATIISMSPLETKAGEVKLTWDQNTDPIDGYKVYHSTTSQLYSNPENAGMLNEFSVKNLTDGQYYFVVTAYRGDLESSYSNEVSAKIETPMRITGVATQGNNTTLNWNASDKSPIRYFVKRGLICDNTMRTNSGATAPTTSATFTLDRTKSWYLKVDAMDINNIVLQSSPSCVLVPKL